eukprot:351140-Chlamydomonas_euryale.AAC.21
MWFERHGLIKLVQKKESVMLSGSRLESKLAPELVAQLREEAGQPQEGRRKRKTSKERDGQAYWDPPLRDRSPAQRDLLRGPPRDEERWEMDDGGNAADHRWEMA